MAPARNLQVSGPSTTLPSTAVVLPLPHHTISSSSYQPDEITPQQVEELHTAFEILQYEVHQSVDSLRQNQHSFRISLQTSLTQNQTSFQNHISAQIEAIQSTVFQAITQRHQPLTTPPQLPNINPPHSHPYTPATTPQILFGSWPENLMPLPPTPPETQLSSTSQPSPHTPPYTSAPPIFSTITSLPQPPFSNTSTASTINTSLPHFNTSVAPNPNQFHHQNNTHHTDYPYYRPPKIDLPRFHGEDAAGWLAMTDRYIRTYCIPPHERVATLAAHFGPNASMWMSAFEQRHPVITWEQFVPAFLEHFGSKSSGDVLASLSHLPQTGSVAEFISEFTKFSCRAPEWDNQALTHMFCGGLKPEIRHDVLAMAPRILVPRSKFGTALRGKIERHQGLYCSASKTHSWSFVPRQHSSTSSSFSSPHHQTYTNPTTTLSHSTTPHRPTQAITQTQRPHNSASYIRLTPSEQRERRAKNLCFNCDEQYSDTHVCKKPFMAILESLVTTTPEESVEFHDCLTSLDESHPNIEDILPPCRYQLCCERSHATHGLDFGHTNSLLY